MRYLISIILLFALGTVFGQTGYRLDFQVKGWKDTTAYLGFYYGESTRVQDTARVNGKGEFFFENKTAVRQGVFFLVLNKSKMIDFLMGPDQHFKLETDTADLIRHMKVTGDEDNRLFFENQKFIADRQAEVAPFMKIIQDTVSKDEQKKSDARAAFSKVNEKVMAEQNEVIARYPKTLTARIFKSTLPLQIPDPPKKANGQVDSTFQLKWYREHFFDNFDLSDDAFIQMPKPIYHEKVKEYLDKLFVPQPDSITRAIEFLVSKAKSNKETYKYLVATCAFLYQAPEIMGLDQVFVNVYKKYFATGEMDYWANAQLRKNYKDLADKISQAQIGTIAPNLMMQDVNQQPRSLYDIKKKYTIVYFFDPDCGHCRMETPKLVQFYAKEKLKYDLEVFAVASDSSLKKLRAFIKEMKMEWITVDGPRTYIATPFTKLYYTETFPSVYILDDRKKVIARKLPVERIELFLVNYEKMKKRPKGS